MSERVFLSYAYQDREIADQVERHLRDRGLVTVSDAVMVDPRKAIQAGDSIRALIKSLMMTADKVVVIITPNSARSLSVAYEAGMASALGKPVYAFVEPGMEGSTLLQALQPGHSVVIGPTRARQ